MFRWDCDSMKVPALRSREDVKRLNPGPGSLDFSSSSPWPSLFVNRSLKEAHEELPANKDLWIIREEERVMQPKFNIGTRNHGALRDAVQDFVILVPSTNFPLGLERSKFGVPEIVQVEWIYEYFAQISFSNGTTREISAGYTALQPVHDPTNTFKG